MIGRKGYGINLSNVVISETSEKQVVPRSPTNVDRFLCLSGSIILYFAAWSFEAFHFANAPSWVGAADRVVIVSRAPSMVVNYASSRSGAETIVAAFTEAA